MGVLMRCWLLAFACGSLSVAGAAQSQAQVTNVVGSAGSQVVFLSSTTPGGTNSLGQGAGVLANNAGSGAAYDASVRVGVDAVSFESGDSVSGPFVRSISSTSIDITMVNGTGATFLPQFNSTIIPEGLGVYLADKSGGCGGNLFTGCPQTLSSWALSDLRASSSASSTDPLAQVSFDFKVLDGGATLYQLTGGMDLKFDPASGKTIVIPNLAAASAALTNFRQTPPLGSASAMGFGWDATDILLTSLTPLDPGQSRTFTYQLTVSSLSSAACLDAATCAVAYIGFGDPVGRGGGVTNAAQLDSSLSSFASLASLSGPNVINGLQFSPFVFNAPSVSNGVLSFTGKAQSVPEPATWALMLAGVGLAGAALRRRRLPVAA